MAIQFKLKNISITDNRIRLQDDTGMYNSVTNTGGYGTPNLDRLDVALFIVGQYKSTKGDILQSVDTFNPLSTTNFYVTLNNDGWYRFSMLNVPIYIPADINDYAPNEILYDTSLDKLVQIIDTLIPNIQPPEFDRTVKIVTMSDISIELLTVATVDLFYVANNSKTKLKLNTTITELIFKQVAFSDKQLIRAKDNYNVLRAVLQGAIYEYSRGNKYVAQKNIEFLNTNNYEVY